MPQSIARVLIVAAQQIHKEHVFPRTPTHGPRLDLAQTDIAEGKDAERLEQYPRSVLHAERQRSLIGMVVAYRQRLSPLDQKEAGEVFLVILNSGLQDLSRVHFRGSAAGNGRRIAQAFCNHMLHASRRVVEGHGLQSPILRKQVAALIERYGM